MNIKVLKNRNIIFYVLGAGTSSLGDVVSGLAFLFLAYDLTGSSIHTTGIAISQAIPYLLFGLVGGVFADWINKKSVTTQPVATNARQIEVIATKHYLSALVG